MSVEHRERAHRPPDIWEIIAHKGREIRYQMGLLMSEDKGGLPVDKAARRIGLGLELEDGIAFHFYREFMSSDDDEKGIDYKDPELRTRAEESFIPTDQEVAVIFRELSRVPDFKGRPTKEELDDIKEEVQITYEDTVNLRRSAFKKALDLLSRKPDKLEFINNDIPEQYSLQKRLLEYLLEIKIEYGNDDLFKAFIMSIFRKFSRNQYINKYEMEEVNDFVYERLMKRNRIEGFRVTEIDSIFGEGYISQGELEEFFYGSVPEIIYPRAVIRIVSKREGRFEEELKEVRKVEEFIPTQDVEQAVTMVESEDRERIYNRLDELENLVFDWFEKTGIPDGGTLKQVQNILPDFISARDVKEFFGDKPIPDILTPDEVVDIRATKEGLYS